MIIIRRLICSLLLLCSGRGAEYCDQFVFVSVSLQAYLWNCWTDLHKFFVQIPFGRGSFLLWRRCDTLCTSGFMDDVTFGCSGPCGDYRRYDTWAESDVCECFVVVINSSCVLCVHTFRNMS